MQCLSRFRMSLLALTTLTLAGFVASPALAAVYCYYTEAPNGTAEACYENRNTCPQIPGLQLQREASVDTCKKPVIQLPPPAGFQELIDLAQQLEELFEQIDAELDIFRDLMDTLRDTLDANGLEKKTSGPLAPFTPLEKTPLVVVPRQGN